MYQFKANSPAGRGAKKVPPEISLKLGVCLAEEIVGWNKNGPRSSVWIQELLSEGKRDKNTVENLP